MSLSYVFEFSLSRKSFCNSFHDPCDLFWFYFKLFSFAFYLYIKRMQPRLLLLFSIVPWFVWTFFYHHDYILNIVKDVLFLSTLWFHYLDLYTYQCYGSSVCETCNTCLLLEVMVSDSFGVITSLTWLLWHLTWSYSTRHLVAYSHCRDVPSEERVMRSGGGLARK